MKNPTLEMILRKARSASISNRGIYPYTKAEHVYLSNGHTLVQYVPDEPVPTPDYSADISDPNTAVTEITTALNNLNTTPDSIIEFNNGEIPINVNLTTGATIIGVNAGIAQNYYQSIA